MKSWYMIRARGTGTEVLIYDEIGAYGVTAKGFLAEFGALPDDAAIDLRLNSPGGSVFDAVAIYNALKRHAGEITVWVDGIAASAASYIAMAGDTIVMPENAFLMIHDPSGLVMGTAEDMRSTAEALDKVKGSLIQGYAAKSGATDEEIANLMSAETWLDAKDALALGFIDRMAEPVKLAASFDVSRFRNAPPELVTAASEPDAPEIAEPQNEDDAGTSAPAEPEHQADTAPTMTDSASVRAEAIAHARMVIDLCRLAGQPHMAGRFLEEDTDLDMVRSRLLAAKAEAEGLPPQSLHAQPGRGAASNPWGDVIARTFKTKG
ncbi:Clp protease ClpP [Roseovarius sp. 10]|uniref:head maturation protease, ClpP-related n=1 Tax=Roseovarius sp. 10 TaxID=3080563 RepID=UPI002952CCE7|nr:head maturation protease, ClpP-related [Roseovarius sp. 10]MDV7200199.1 Clp protease ClpP [Roseovarius sp. 10]